MWIPDGPFGAHYEWATSLPYQGGSIFDTSRTQRHDAAAVLCNGTSCPALPSTPCASSTASALRLMMPRAVTLGTRTWMGLERPSRIGPNGRPSAAAFSRLKE